MSDIPEARAASTEAYLAEAATKLSALCTACGRCFDACPMVDAISLRAANASAVTAGLIELARGESGPADTVTWVGACAKSGLCVAACPEREKGLDAMLLIRIARQRAINDTHQIAPKGDPAMFPRVKTFARLQLTEEELKSWL